MQYQVPLSFLLFFCISSFSAQQNNHTISNKHDTLNLLNFYLRFGWSLLSYNSFLWYFQNSMASFFSASEYLCGSKLLVGFYFKLSLTFLNFRSFILFFFLFRDFPWINTLIMYCILSSILPSFIWIVPYKLFLALCLLYCSPRYNLKCIVWLIYYVFHITSKHANEWQYSPLNKFISIENIKMYYIYTIRILSIASLYLLLSCLW